MKTLFRLFALVSCWLFLLVPAYGEVLPFSEGWKFLLNDEPRAFSKAFDDSKWEDVTLPHTPRIEGLPAGKKAPQWQGICWYRKTFELPAAAAGKHIVIRFEGAMNIAEIWVNGERAGKFMGGYLPYVQDISLLAKPGRKNSVAVRLDNRDNPLTGPKPLADLDFNLYGGLYRPAYLVIQDGLHITDPNLEDKVAGGGVFVTFPEVSSESARVQIKTHIRNAHSEARGVVLRNVLVAPDGKPVAQIDTDAGALASGKDREISQSLQISSPQLWSPRSPSLYTVRTELMHGGKVTDSQQTRIGIRRITITPSGFSINGERMFLRGCNRHQEYPYVGNAVSDAAHYRDALKIKEAGFDYVRLSHYPQSAAFLDACDELGLVVMDSLMGWQYFGKDPSFAELKYQECRQMIRRDRNHPSVMLWEVSLNESAMPREFVAKTHAIAHEEYPGDQCYTCGWTRGYDVFIQARQHGGCKQSKDIPCIVSEYGDWEYLAQNAGLEQHKWKDLQPAERSSRQLRGDGEVRMLQQALNFQEAHNDNLSTTAFGDGIWVMFDYSRGYAEDIESSGVMDVFRLPKFGYWFFRSQRDPAELVSGKPVGPVVYIANYWTPDSPLEVRVFSNCDEIALELNGKPVERRRPDVSRITGNLRHAPFTFRLTEFEAGTLAAIGYAEGREVARHERRSPGQPASLSLKLDTAGRPVAASGKDAVFVHAEVLDERGTVVPFSVLSVGFGATGPSKIIGKNPAPAEAGIASALVQVDKGSPNFSVYAAALVESGGRVRILSGSAGANGIKPEACEVRYTTDGSEPSTSSPEAKESVAASGPLRAALFVKGRRLRLLTLGSK